MKKNKIILVIFCLFAILCLTGCKSKTAKSSDDFKSLAEKYNLEFVDVTSQFASYSYAKGAFLAKSSDDWQVEFFVLEDADYATNAFYVNKSNFDSFKGSSSSYVSLSGDNYENYTLNSNGYYMYICRVDNTLIFVKVLDTYKDNAQKFVEEFGY